MTATSTEQQRAIGREVWRLHELSTEAELIYDLSLGEATAETSALEEWIAGATDDTLHALAQFKAELEGRAAAIATEEKRLAEVKRRNKARQEWVKARTLEVMKALGVKSKDVGTFTITIIPPKPHVEQTCSDDEIDFETLELIDPSLVKRGDPKPVKAAILKLLKSGREVPGFMKVDGSESVKWG